MPAERGVDIAVDIAVVGAGPAGALAARQLARFGFRVVLVHGPRKLRRLGESLGASAPRLLASFGLEPPESVWAPRPGDHLVRWAGRSHRVAVRPPGGSPAEGQRLVWRDRFDAWARSEARRAGAEIVEGWAGRDDDPAVLAVRRDEGDRLRLRAAALVDASGRSGVLTRGRRRWPDFRTTALTAHFPGGSEPGTLVAALPEGWLWSAPLPHGRRDVTVLLDREAVAGDLREHYRAALEHTDLGAFVAGAPLTPVAAADATPYALRDPGPEEPPLVIAVGDAMSALDPLTGLGAMKAMDSGLTAAVVLRTALERPERLELALRFHRDKERGIARETANRIARFYAEERRFADRRFWIRRSRATPAPKRPGLPERFHPARGARVETRGVLRGDWIEPAEVLVLEGRCRPAHRVAGVSLPDIIRTARGGTTIRDLTRRLDAPREAVEAAARWLAAEGFLTREPEPRSQQPVDKTPRRGIRPRRDGEPRRPGGCGAPPPTGWRPESLPRSVPPAFAGRANPPRTPPGRKQESASIRGCGELFPQAGGPNRFRDPFRRLSRGGRTLPAPLPGGASRRVGVRGTFSTAC